MNKLSKLWAGVAAGCLLAGGLGVPVVQAQDDAKVDRTAIDVEVKERRSAARVGDVKVAPVKAIRASKLIGMDVKNLGGEKLGDIDDLVIDTSNGTIRYAALSFGGFLGIGDKLFAIPFESFTMAEEADDPGDFYLVLNVSEEQLKGAPGFDKDNWPAVGNDYWTNVDKHFPQDTLEDETQEETTLPKTPDRTVE